MFTGTMDGRIIEILQNARRAGATQVSIKNNDDGTVRITDNGCGIADFAKLLDMGGSGWDEKLESSEDPAGVGIFSLAPRDLSIISGSQKITINQKGWTGKLIEVEDVGDYSGGTTMLFADESWDLKTVEPHAVFSGMQVIVDGKRCVKEEFCSKAAVHYSELGCKIEVQSNGKLSKWHQHFNEYAYRSEAMVNFHGQVVVFSYSPMEEHEMRFLVDMTGEPTGIRLMLPARTQLIANEALEKLKNAIEIEVYRYIQRRGTHKLPFKDYQRARQLGILLPESTPVFDVGTLSGDILEPAEVTKPDDFPLEKCYRICEKLTKHESHNIDTWSRRIRTIRRIGGGIEFCVFCAICERDNVIKLAMLARKKV